MLIVVALGVVFCLSSLAPAQPSSPSRSLDEASARKNLLLSPNAVYPPIARAARVQGDVVIAIVINAKGEVASEKVLSGPPMLQQAALDAVRKWTFKPFAENGSAVAVSTTVRIPFHLDNPREGPTPQQEKAAQEYFPISEKCRAAVKAQNAEDSVRFCKAALDKSMEAGVTTPSDQLVRVESHQYYGHALLMAGRLEDALAEENSAVDAAKKGLTDVNQEYAMPFFWRAMVEIRLGQADAALADFTISEDTHRKAMADLPDMKDKYGQYLASILRQHAALLEQLGRTEEARKLRAEAASL